MRDIMCVSFSPNQPGWHSIISNPVSVEVKNKVVPHNGFKATLELSSPSAVAPLLSNHPWYAAGHDKISSQVTKVGSNNSLAFHSSPMQLLTITCHKNKRFTTNDGLFVFNLRCLQPPGIFIWANSTVPFQAEMQCSLGLFVGGTT